MEEFNGGDIPPYVILSHVWDDEEEVTFRDMTESPDILVNARSKRGYRKLATTCKIAAAEGFKHAWIDTCCIDKSSSAELSESINSMFRWYRRAAKCYVYLADLAPAHVNLPFEDGLSKCRWFTRGFTLQELIAPSQIKFFDQEWNFRTTKRNCVKLLSDITGIDVEILRHQKPLSSIPVAQRMAWAADRQTTKVEDLAYCLFGIFDVNMPLLYGEEEKAFLGLQEEILKNTMDLTILAWTMPEWVANFADKSEASEESTYSILYRGLLVSNNSYFNTKCLVRKYLYNQDLPL